MSDPIEKNYEEECDIQVEAEEKETPSNSWEFTKVWNTALEQDKSRPVVSRDRIWASELGKSAVDIYLKMKGIEPTNPPNPRSLRKFEAGNMFEWVVSLILKRAGILQESQKWSAYQYPGMVQVTGKADFLAGGIPKDTEQVVKEMEGLGLPDFFLRGAKAIVEHLKNLGELKEMPLEIKSVSAFMFDALEKKGNSSKNHRLQLFHYLKAMNYESGNLVYICRDDLRMMEVKINNNAIIEAEYKGFIENISKYFLAGEQPPLEKAVVFDTDLGKFAKNWNVAYSNYLTKLYGFKDQKEFDDKHTPIVAKWNRVLGRIKGGKIMTNKNKIVVEEITSAGFKVEELLKNFSGEFEEEENA